MRKLLFSLAALTLIVGCSSSRADDQPGSATTIGHAAPSFTLPDQNGKNVSLSDYSGKVIVLEWFNAGCPFVQKHYNGQHMNQLAKKYTDKGVVWLAINSTDGTSNASNAKIAEQWKISRPILHDGDMKVAAAYGAKTTPHMFIIDKTGKLVYAGAIDDDASDDASKVAGAKNYVAQALDQVLAGQAVTESETKSYGCSVKYKQ